MLISRMLAHVLLASALFTTTACGDEAGNKTPIQDLSPAERQTECEVITETINASQFQANQRTLSCYASGAMMGDSCEQTVAECMDDASPNVTIEGGVSCEDIASWDNCKASSAEIIACYKDLDANLAKHVNGITCDNGMERMMEYANQTPATCTKLAEKCPDALGGNDDDGSDWGDDGSDWGSDWDSDASDF